MFSIEKLKKVKEGCSIEKKEIKNSSPNIPLLKTSKFKHKEESSVETSKYKNLKNKLDTKWKLYNHLKSQDSKEVNEPKELKLLAFSHNTANENIGYSLHKTIEQIVKVKRKHQAIKREKKPVMKLYDMKNNLSHGAQKREMKAIMKVNKIKNKFTPNAKLLNKGENEKDKISPEFENKYTKYGYQMEGLDNKYPTAEGSEGAECQYVEEFNNQTCTDGHKTKQHKQMEYKIEGLCEVASEGVESKAGKYTKFKSKYTEYGYPTAEEYEEAECQDAEEFNNQTCTGLKTKQHEQMEYEIENRKESDKAKVVNVDLDRYKYLKLLSEKNKLNMLEKVPLLTKKDNLYLSLKPHGENSLLVALFPETKIFLHGYYHLQLVLGSVTVIGYKFKEGEERVIYSPSTHSILPINVNEGTRVKILNDEQLAKLKIPSDWVKNFPIGKDQLVVIVKLTRYQSNMTNLLSISKMVDYPTNDGTMLNHVGLQIENPKRSKMKLLSEADSWSDICRELRPMIENKSRICIVVGGGQSVGKSTFWRFLINHFLSCKNVPEVACLDLDPGQTELALTSVISLAKVTSPLLGPSFTHRDTSEFNFVRKFFLGDVNVQLVLKEYMDGIEVLTSELHKLDISIPVVINTIGFTADLGYDIMVDVIRFVEPTHIINLRCADLRRNYQMPLACDVISVTNRGIIQQPYKNMHYELVNMEIAHRNLAKANKVLRNLNIMSYFSKLWNINEPIISRNSIQPPIKVDWCKIAIQVQGSFVPKSHIMQAINASLVALCKIEREYLEEIDTHFPLKVLDGIPWNQFCTVFGWGIVRGIDPEKREIHLYTHIRLEELLEMNLLILPKIYLPKEFYDLFYEDEAPYWIKV